MLITFKQIPYNYFEFSSKRILDKESKSDFIIIFFFFFFGGGGGGGVRRGGGVQGPLFCSKFLFKISGIFIF